MKIMFVTYKQREDKNNVLVDLKENNEKNIFFISQSALLKFGDVDALEEFEQSLVNQKRFEKC